MNKERIAELIGAIGLFLAMVLLLVHYGDFKEAAHNERIQEEQKVIAEGNTDSAGEHHHETGHDEERH